MQNNLYSSKRKKSVFSDEDKNIIKRFKKSVDETKATCVIPQKLQKSEDINYCNNQSNNILMATNIPSIAPLLFTPSVVCNVDSNIDINNIDINMR